MIRKWKIIKKRKIGNNVNEKSKNEHNENKNMNWNKK